MSAGIVHLAQIPGRAEPSDASEMVTQLLFGEVFMVLERKGSWVKIQCAWDNYKCWIDEKQFRPLHADSASDPNPASTITSQEVVGVVHNLADATSMPIVLGSTLPGYNGKTCTVGDLEFGYTGAISDPFAGTKGLIAENAHSYLNAPYLWGGRSPFGIDCSGFTQMAYKLSGIQIPRDAYEQARVGNALSFVEEAEPGDLAFFDNDEGRIIHVGIMLGDHKIIHASGKVRIDKIDHQGIFNVDTGRYSHSLRIIKRIL